MVEVITALLIANSAPGAIPAEVLAPAIMQAAVKHRVSAVLLTRILLVESRGVANAYNPITQDYGLLQINERTRRSYGLTNRCMANWRCNLDAGAMILADLLAIDGSRACTYNIGPRGRFAKYKEPCERYEHRIASF